MSWGFLSFAFITHVTSAHDALRQSAFPVFRRRTTVIMSAGSLGFLVYAPALYCSFLLAWPGYPPAGTGSGYLVNCWAYRGQGPRQGDWIWLRLPPRSQPHAARVIAVAGQEVEWNGHQWRVDGQQRPLRSSLTVAAWPQACRFTVPPSQVLVEPEDEGGYSQAPCPLVLVAEGRIIGRAWAQFYPVWERRLL
jgi:hypothetical protein